MTNSLWGNPLHLKCMADELRKKHPEENLNILVAKRNSGSFTYDGIELGGERVCQEIEEELEKLARAGQEIKRLSLVGYSLGGLVARYAVGLLHSKGTFEKITPVVCISLNQAGKYTDQDVAVIHHLRDTALRSSHPSKRLAQSHVECSWSTHFIGIRSSALYHRHVQKYWQTALRGLG
jgi:predicted esterase